MLKLVLLFFISFNMLDLSTLNQSQSDIKAVSKREIMGVREMTCVRGMKAPAIVTDSLLMFEGHIYFE